MPSFIEIREKLYKNIQMDCSTRAKLLYLQLKHMGHNPIILRYFIKGEENKNDDKRKKITLIDGQEFSSHVVVLLDNFILDTNISKILTKEEYEEQTKKKSNSDIIGVEYNPMVDSLCKRYVGEYKLDQFRHLSYSNSCGKRYMRK